MDSLTTVDHFIEQTDKGTLFNSTEGAFYTAMRRDLRIALVDLLFWRRPEVERKRGIFSIYDLFTQRLSLFESYANGPDAFTVREAMFFLAFLPFPGQWKWIEKVSKCYADHLEVQLFLKDEKSRIQKKIQKKQFKTFKLKHFCQILKPPALPGEKGVLRIFSMPYLFFSVPHLLKKISSHYFLYVEPAAGINFRHEWLRVYATLNDPVLFGLSSPEDRRFMGSQPGLINTSLAHGDYLKPFRDLPAKEKNPPSLKRYDIVFNNTFDERQRKRHTLMLKLMQHPLLEKITVLFLGRGSHENVEGFIQEIRENGLEKRAYVVANIMRREVPGYLAQCRAGVHLALQENGCRAVYEYLRSDLPCIISRATAGMNMEIITPETGIAAGDFELAQAIAQVLDNPSQYHPAQWFQRNSGSLHSSKALNRILKKHYAEPHGSWQKDIVPLTSSGLGRYARKEDYEAFKPYFKELLDLFLQEKTLPITLDS